MSSIWAKGCIFIVCVLSDLTSLPLLSGGRKRESHGILLYARLTSYLLRLSLSYLILAVPTRECLGKHSCMSSSFPIAILNDTSPFISLVQEKLNMPAGHFYRHCS